jgi:uncharacterized protein (DUF427 family)
MGGFAGEENTMLQVTLPQYEKNPAYFVVVEPTPKRIRGMFNGEFVVDTTNAVILHEKNHVPVYYFPIEDVRADIISPTDHSTNCPYKGDASYWSLQVGDRMAENVVWSYKEPLEECPELNGYMAFYWNKIDAWFEEDEEVYVHARDPYKRIDILQSSRHVEIVIDGVTVADTHRPTILLEGTLPTRYYIPRLDLRNEALVPTSTRTQCPYKGEAGYFSVQSPDREVKDVAWYYQNPTIESSKIAGLVSFFNERVEVYVDGELQERPKSKWSE